MYRDSTVLAWCVLILGVFGIADGSDILIGGAMHTDGVVARRYAASRCCFRSFLVLL